MAAPSSTPVPVTPALSSSADAQHKLDLTQPRPESYFCEHNPRLNEFAFSGADEMAATVIFAVASQLKDWGTIFTLYPYLIQYLKDGKRVDIYDKKEVGQLGVLLFPHNQSIQKLWNARQAIFSQISALRGKPEELYRYLRSLPGLGIVKAGFAIQLIAGRFGCLDSVNSYFYGAQAPATQRNTDKAAQGYLDFLAQLEKSLQDPISKRLWDDWCDIVAHRIRNSTEGGKLKSLTVDMPHKEGTVLRSYPTSFVTQDYYQNGGAKTGHDVSREHGETITAAFARDNEYRQSFIKESERWLGHLLREESTEAAQRAYLRDRLQESLRLCLGSGTPTQSPGA